MNSPQISFIICSWQAPPSLDETLFSLAMQADQNAFETIVVNNGFSEARAQELRKAFASLKLKILLEPQLGQGFARRKGFLEAKGEILVLLDDDNTLEKDFVAPLLKLADAYPHWGAVCPAVLPRWEIQPPKWLEEFGRQCLSYTSPRLQGIARRYWNCEELGQTNRPPGGGMILHREIAQRYLASLNGPARLKLSRVGNSLMAGEDADIFSFVEKTGRGMIQTEQLVVYHHIPRRRLRLGYLLRLNYAMLKSYAIWQILLQGRKGFRWSAELIDLLRLTAGLLWDCMRGRKTPAHCLCLLARKLGWISGYWLESGAQRYRDGF